MKLYIVDALKEQINIVANSVQDAEEIALKMYRDGDIKPVLVASAMGKVAIQVVEKEDA